MIIGGLWLAAEDRPQAKTDIHILRNKYKIGGEFKWQKVSPSRQDFYREMSGWFVAMGDLRSVGNRGVQRVRRQADFHNIAVCRQRVTGSQDVPVSAAGYRRSRCTR